MTRALVAPVSLFALVLAACGPTAEPLSPPPPLPPERTSAPAPTTTASAAPDFRATAPASGPEAPFVPPVFSEVTLANGIRVLVAERHELPVMAIKLAFERGADQAPPGLASFLTAMLFQGTTSKSAIALSDELRGLGLSAEASADHDALWISAQGLATQLPAALAILADVVQHPALAKDEIARVRSRRLTALLQQNDQPAALLGNTTLALLYPVGHPYHLPLIGDEAAANALTAADLARLHRESFAPDRLIVAVAGDVEKADVAAQIERALGAWKGSVPAPSTPSRPVDAGSPRVTLVDRPGLTQSSVAVAMVGEPRITADHDALALMNTILGGYYSSRLNQNLRERHAYTYGARSSFDVRRGPGPFTAGGTVVREQTGPAIQEIFAEIRRMREEPVPASELEDARIRAIRRLPARFESVAEIAGAMADLRVSGLPLDEYATLPARLRSITADDVQRAAASHLAEERLRVIVVGDAKVVKEQLDALGMGEVALKSPPAKVEKIEKSEKAAPKGGAVKAPAGKSPAAKPAKKPAAKKPGKK